ncbi:MAG: VCBS repeat-containing protein, partial [Caldilineaceae bacterium]|nr:VCBS repeat-containing protein [Caldilineaceae bacterium]
MSNKSGTSAQIISLPSGGGALRGIGETFSPDLHTGTGNFTVPLALPLGRSGFQPQLNLVYSTGNGNGPFGLGWSLSIPGVSRKTAKGVPRYDDALDTFILSGAEDLAPVPGGAAGVTRYRPRTEGLFARIQHQHDAKNDYWRVQSKDGLISIYGTPGPEQAVPNWQDPAVIADPADRTKIFAWKLTRTVDPFGNRIEYLYERDPVWIEGPHQWDQLYLSQIRYIDYGDPITPQFLVTIHFIYDDRPDPFSEYRPGFELRTVRRCTQIDLFTHHNTDTLARTYHFIYLDQRDLPIAQRPLNGVSLLSQVRVVGHDGEHTEELPPLEFGYTRFEPARRDFFPVTGPDMPPGSLARPDYELADLLGNGLPDVLEMNGLVRYWRNLGGGQFDRPRPMRDAPAGLALADPGVQLIDADGDGRIDLLTTIDGLAGYFPLRFNGQWDRHSFRRYRQTPSFSLEDPEVRLVDLDGDGVTDAVRSGGRFECFFNDPKEGWNHTRRVERQALESFPNINFSDPHVKWADMTGDGLQDIVLVHDGNVEYWPNRGHGNWAQRISMRKSPRLPYGYDPGRVLVGDVDGDGLADLVYVEDTQVRLWINQAGNSWSDPLIIQGTPSVSDMDAVRLIDLLGAGISGILWSADANGLSRSSMFFLDFTGGSKPYLLQEMDNHMGAMTRVTYAPSTRFYREDQQDPKTRWRTSLPFPVQVVTYVEVIDELSKGKLTTEYRYHHGYWDGGEREFRGFGMVEQFDTETFEQYNAAGLHGEIDFTSVEKIHFSPPTYTKTWFHQGPVGDEFGEWEELDYSSDFWPGDPPALTRPQSMTDLLKALPRRVKRDALRALRGSILRTELYALDSTALQERPYTVTESLFGLREEAAPGVDEQERLPIFYPHLLAQRTTQWERGDESMTQFTFTDSEDYDAYGQPRRQTQVACPRRWRKLADKPSQTGMTEQERRFLATRTVTAYAQRDDEQLFIVDRVARTTTYEIESDGNEL